MKLQINDGYPNHCIVCQALSIRALPIVGAKHDRTQGHFSRRIAALQNGDFEMIFSSGTGFSKAYHLL
jgi:hypothetical protein